MREGGQSKREVGKRVEVGSHGSEERRSGGGNGVSGVDFVCLIGGGRVGTSGGGDVDVVGDLNQPRKNESISTVETFDGTEEMLEILSSRRVKIDVIEFEPVAESQQT